MLARLLPLLLLLAISTAPFASAEIPQPPPDPVYYVKDTALTLVSQIVCASTESGGGGPQWGGPELDLGVICWNGRLTLGPCSTLDLSPTRDEIANLLA